MINGRLSAFRRFVLCSVAVTGILLANNVRTVFADTIIGTDNADNLIGTAERDAIYGLAGDDNLQGLDGDDNLFGDDGNDILDAGTGYNVLSGGPGDDYLSAMGVGGNRLDGGDGNDHLTGSDGQNFFDGGGGADTMVGGKGENYYSVDELDTVIASLDGGNIDDVRFYTPVYHLTFPNIEFLTYMGSGEFTAYGNDEANNIGASVTGGRRTLYGMGGRDVLAGGAYDDDLYGGEDNDGFYGNGGNDRMWGGNGSDWFAGWEGDDEIWGEEGDDNLDGGNGGDETNYQTDILHGGLGNDWYNIRSPNAVVIENAGEGFDTIRLWISSFTLPENVERVIGSDGSDTIVGNDGDNSISGGGGADLLNGVGGSDTASYADAPTGVIADLSNPQTNTGDAAGDSYTSIENLQGSSAGDTLTGDMGANLVTGGTGNDVINGDPSSSAANLLDTDTVNSLASLENSSSSDTVSDRREGLIFRSGQTVERMFENANAVHSNRTVQDLYFTTLALETVVLSNDILTGGSGDDTINGGPGEDTAVYSGKFSEYQFSYSSTNQSFTVKDKRDGGDGTDVLTSIEKLQFSDGVRTATGLSSILGDAGSNKLVGTAGADNILGMDGNDNLNGLAGDDMLDGGAGADIMSGGDGNDSYTVDNAGDKVKEAAKPGSGVDTVYTSLPSYRMPPNVENLVYTGGSNFSGIGSKNNNRMSGGPANDTLDGQKGVDVLIGGLGDDTYIVDSPSDLVLEDADSGTDAVVSSTTVTTLNQNVEILSLKKGNINGTGNALDNVIIGSLSNNILSGGDGADTLIGGMGNDTFYGETAASPGDDADTISYGGAKKGVVFSLANTLVAQKTGGAGTDRIYDISGIENLTGTSFPDNLTGSAVANIIHGSDSNDLIYGLSGADVLYGDAGLDAIDCGSDGDVDRVAYVQPSESPVGVNRDQVSSFNSDNDLVDLSLMDANVNIDGDQAFVFNDTTPQANSVWYVVSGTDTIVQGDVNGDAAPDFEVLVKGVASLAAGNLAL